MYSPFAEIPSGNPLRPCTCDQVIFLPLCCTQALVNNPAFLHVIKPIVTRMAFVFPSFTTNNSVGCAFFFFFFAATRHTHTKSKQKSKHTNKQPYPTYAYHQLCVCLSPQEFVSEKCHRYQSPIHHKRTCGHPNCCPSAKHHVA